MQDFDLIVIGAGSAGVWSRRPNGEVLGVHELSLAIDQRIKLAELASSMHVYPTYAIGVQQLAAELRLESLAASRTVKLARGLASLR